MEGSRNPNRLSIVEFETKVLRGLYGIAVRPDAPKDDPDAIYRNDWLPRTGKGRADKL